MALPGETTGRQPTVVAVLGAESTGKSSLVTALARTLRAEGHDVVVVDEALRDFCAARGRTPQHHEQQAIAQRQTEAISNAAACHDLVLADTTALVTAAYSEIMFDDRSLLASAITCQRRYTLTLLCGLDLPWRADGHQRSGEHSRAPLDAWLRQALQTAAIPYAVIYGSGDARLQAALRAVQPAVRPASPQPATWRWRCRHCSDDD